MKGLEAIVFLPLAALAAACFLKASIVLGLLARALGGRAIPQLAIVAAALLLVGFVLAPVAERSVAAAGGAVVRGEPSGVAPRAAEPVRAFLERQVPAEARRELVELQQKYRGPDGGTVSDRDLVVLVPAFAVAELKAAFRVGFFLLLPFLVLDLLIAVVLLALGMHTIDARTIALPCKLLLFVAVDGWALVTRGLLGGYAG